ncbi:type II toxin-antitoxin system Phd/YefM family antitoxin [Pseudothauera hydrothermalis]|uniref:type II toxin-antitoxin system Phd/YefM family antitoxin n=1 Tax=Pseudothauera hydrothermalis TaxID=2184083 RepID=UPI000E09C59A|nr:hypothetical protein [Pseudothauera hydrothermalis]
MHLLTTDELNRQPNSLLADAHRGEPALVTDHGKPVFMTVPIGAGLDTGKRHVQALGRATDAAVLLDEPAGRRVAAQQGLLVVGTLGLLIRAREGGVFPALRPLVDTLQDLGYFPLPMLIERPPADLGQS